MARPFDPREMVTIQEIAISNMLENKALIELLLENTVVHKRNLLEKWNVGILE